MTKASLLSRRAALGAASTLFLWPYAPRAAQRPGGRDLRLLVVVLRGAIDGLAAVPAVGDPSYLSARAPDARQGDPLEGVLDLDGYFALHPALPGLAASFRRGEALIAHAVATGYRGRSHFDGQDVLESGMPNPGYTASGWLNRALARIAAERVGTTRGLGIGATPPLVIRGPAPVLGWNPPVLAPAGEDLIRRTLDLYDRTDPRLHAALAAAIDTKALATGGEDATGRPAMQLLAEGAARLMAPADGARVAACALDGWDTHANQGAAVGRLATLLSGLDAFLTAYEAGMGQVWADTVVAVVSEFGRTVALNGTLGSDHGTGTVAFFVGGAVAGGRVLADWPGLSRAALLDGRDLRPTADLRGLLAGVLADGFGLGAGVIGAEVFPDATPVASTTGLLA